MSVKDKRDFLVRFHGEKEVKAYTLDHAREEVENMKNIAPEKGITTLSNWDVIQESVILNLPAVVSMSFSIVYISVMFIILHQIALFEDEAIELLGLIVWVVLLLITLRLPRTVERKCRISRDD